MTLYFTCFLVFVLFSAVLVPSTNAVFIFSSVLNCIALGAKLTIFILKYNESNGIAMFVNYTHNNKFTVVAKKTGTLLNHKRNFLQFNKETSPDASKINIKHFVVKIPQFWRRQNNRNFHIKIAEQTADFQDGIDLEKKRRNIFTF